MLSYSLSPNPFPDSKPLNGATIPAGTKIYPFYTAASTGERLPYSFFDNGTKVGNSESQPPFEVGNGNGWNPTSGAHKLEVKDGLGAIKETAQFTVGTVTPPPTTKESVTVNVKADISKVDVKFQVNGQPV